MKIFLNICYINALINGISVLIYVINLSRHIDSMRQI